MSRKRFGQHFLRDQSVIRKIITAINPSEEDTIVEIGPGEGVLTDFLIESRANVIGIEIDRDLVKRLKSRYGQQLTLLEGDVLDVDFHRLSQSKIRIVGNLPYNISTPLLLKLASAKSCIKDCHVMLQKEMGERLCASVGQSAYSRLTVTMALVMQSQALFEILPMAFHSPPKVDSIFLRLLPHLQIFSNIDTLPMVLRTAFQYRRKSLRNALSSLSIDWEECKIDSDKRPAELSPIQYYQLALYLSKKQSG